MDTDVFQPEPATDIVTAKPQRRRFSPGFKRRVVEEVLAGQDSVSVIARRHDINANQLFRWKREHLGKPSSGATGEELLPVQIAGVSVTDGIADQGPPGRIDIALGAGRRVTVQGSVPPAMLRLVLEVLSR